MIRAEAVAVIHADPRTILEFVADLDQYRQADRKFAKVSVLPVVSEEQPVSETRYRGRLRGLPTPSEWQVVTLEPWSRLTFRSKPGQWTAKMATFDGGFRCTEVPEGTEVTHYESFSFKGPGRLVAEPFLRRWLQREIEGEMERLKKLIEPTGDPAGAGPGQPSTT